MNEIVTKSKQIREITMSAVSSPNLIEYINLCYSQISDVKSLALRVTSINLVSLERGSIVEYVFPCFQLGKLDLGVT